MERNESRVLESAATLYNAIPGYLAGNDSKYEVGHLLVNLIDALDDIEYSRSGTPLFDIIDGSLPGRRKAIILKLERQYGLTKRESLILRYLANDRNPSYISNALRISTSTAKAHKYSIYKKLGIHSSSELKEMLSAKTVEEGEVAES